MDISVVIPTYNGSKRIVKCLDSILEQSLLPKEIIVVVDGSMDNTVELIDSYASGIPLKVIKQANQGRSVARNNGAKKATGELFVFIDDDIRIEPMALELHCQAQAQPGLYTGMQVEDPRKCRSDFDFYRRQLSLKWLSRLPKNRPMKKGELFLTAANFSIPRAFFQCLNGFDVRLKDAEDYDLAVRAHDKGFLVQYLPTAIGWHDDQVTLGNYLLRLREYREGHKELLKLSSKVEEGVGVPFDRSSSGGARRLFFRMFLSNFWVIQIEESRLSFLPRFLRFRIYDWVITAYSSYFPTYPLRR